MTTRSTYLENHPLQKDELCVSLMAETERLWAELGSGDRRGMTLAKETGLNMVLTALRAGARIGGRETPGPSAVQVLAGCVRVQAPGPEMELRAGDMVVFNPRTGQEIVAVENSTVLVTVAMGPAEPYDMPPPRDPAG
jgi:quercetin dioxygenase-like cupin family protein